MTSLPHVLAAIALLFAVLSLVPFPANWPGWVGHGLLAVAVLLLAILQFAG